MLPRLATKCRSLHVHVIARYANDAAWPGPVWNAGVAENVNGSTIVSRAALLRSSCGF